jgi:predicted dehydrogenase
MTQPIRIGLVGAGFAARFHLRGLQRVYGVPVEVAGVTARSAETRDRFERETGVRAFDSFDALCDAVDVVDLCSPPSTHEELAVAALRRGRHVIAEKPLTGYFGDGTPEFRGDTFPKETMLREAIASCERILDAARTAGRILCYAENWIYAPAIRKECEIVARSGAQILWMLGNQSHSGSHSPYYGIWRHSGGGSLVGKGCHPVSAALYLKRVEGEARDGSPIRPVTVSARTHELTRLSAYRDEGVLRRGYQDIEDYGHLHIVFSDGTIADLFASEILLGGVSNWLEVMANNHRTRCNLNPVDAVETFAPREETLRDVYTVEKIETKLGWGRPAADEAWQHGYPQEFQDFVESIAAGRAPLATAELARDTMVTLYAAYVSAERHGAEVEIPA